MVPSGSLAAAVSGTSAGASNGPAGTSSVTVGGCSPQLMPLTEKDVGSALVPLYVALKPMCAASPVPRSPFHDSLVAVTSLPS